jgi:protein ImuB
MLFACLFVPPRPDTAADTAALVALARDFSPRIEVHAPHLVTLDVAGLRTLLGAPRTIGGELRASAASRGLYAHVAICASRAAAVVLAAARGGLTVVDAGGEAAALAPLPLRALETAWPLIGTACLATFRRWGLKTIGDVAALSPVALFERMGAVGVAWHALATGADPWPLVPTNDDEHFEESLELEWPIDGLEPLSFVLGRLFDPLCAHLEDRDRAVAVLHVRLRLVTREVYARRLELPAPIRDARALRTLALLDLESHPPGAAIDVVTVAADPTPGRVLQYSLLTRALPAAERVSTLVARLTALIGEGRVGAPALVDSYRPGAFQMRTFTVTEEKRELHAAVHHQRSERQIQNPDTVQGVLRRFRHPVAARVTLENGRPARLTTDRRGFGGGSITECAGPWRSSGDWWMPSVRPTAGDSDRRAGPAAPTPTAQTQAWASKQRSGYGVYGSIVPSGDAVDGTRRTPLDGRGAIVPDPASTANDREGQAEYIYALNFLVRESPAALLRERPNADGPLFPVPRPSAPPWHLDEWDVALADGAAYRLVRDRDTDRWFVAGVID